MNEASGMNSLRELIDEIERRPGLYLGQPSIGRLSSFVSGWALARQNPEDTQTLQRFQRFVERRFRIETTHHWDRVIPFFSRDEAEALKQFFALYREFEERASIDD